VIGCRIYLKLSLKTFNLDSNLASDLDVDSIDAVDLVVKIKELTGKQVQPEDFKAVRTYKMWLLLFKI
jgi:acyl carrier protein